jgi:hypothetical protein
VKERIGPKTRIKIGTRQEGTQGVADGLMSAFNRTGLMGRIGASRINIVSKFLKESTDLWVVVKFTTLIHVNALVGNLWRVAHEPLSEPVNGGTFGDANGAVESASIVIFDDDKTRLTIDPFVGGGSRLVLGSLPSKRKVDGEALIRSSGLHRRHMSRRTLPHFGRKTGRAAVEDRIMVLEGRDANDVLVRVVEVIITAMSESLMPEKTIRSNGEFMQKKRTLDGVGGTIGVGHKRMETGVERSKGRRTGDRVVTRRVLRQEQRLGVAESSIKISMDDDIFRSTQSTVNGKGEITSSGILVKSSTVTG